MKEDKRIFTLSEENPYKAVVKLGVPLICGMFVMVLYNYVDTYFIGLMDGKLEIESKSGFTVRVFLRTIQGRI